MFKVSLRRLLWLALFLAGCYAIYHGFTDEPRLSASPEVRMSAAASFFSPQGDLDQRQIQVRSAPMAALGDDGEDDEDLAVRLQFREVLRDFDMNQVGSTPAALAKLKSLAPDRTLLARLFKDELEILGQQKTDERDKLVWLANTLQAPELLAFWQDLAMRQTARYENEASMRNPKQPNLDSRAVDIEQLQAIRNLGLIANERAAATLKVIILRPDASAHRILHREQAFKALQKAEPNSALSVLGQLPADDELLQRIKAR